MNIETLQHLIQNNGGTLLFIVIGSFILTGYSFREHLMREEADKMTNKVYIFHLLGWIIGYPFLGLIVGLSYLNGENSFGNWLALQIGLTSPAIVLSIIKGGAEKFANANRIETTTGQ
ncbi:hypothetical protein PJV97_00095 [Aliarcobacter butzleri]|uniref:hypothetical protein n=1 Tax=Aliarcobacter butzleri TaxID=28197 RepID=UPI00263C1D85|nr:hypothetical protein [Aliarcobacter butzleri]MDN5110736.1 hypothetical protein [Aliarcobacter butzleri]